MADLPRSRLRDRIGGKIDRLVVKVNSALRVPSRSRAGSRSPSRKIEESYESQPSSTSTQPWSDSNRMGPAEEVVLTNGGFQQSPEVSPRQGISFSEPNSTSARERIARRLYHASFSDTVTPHDSISRQTTTEHSSSRSGRWPTFTGTFSDQKTGTDAESQSPGAVKMIETGPKGLHCIFKVPTEAVEADIIFIHGLGGGSNRTWCTKKKPIVCWPKELLPQDIPHARIHAFGYDADFRTPGSSTQNVNDFARDLIEHMRVYNAEYPRFGEYPIIFVVHSMGGLVVKKALVLAQQEAHYTRTGSDTRFRNLFSNIIGILFLGTPHKGSESAQALENVLRLTLSGSKAYVTDLKKDSAMLQSINDEFRFIADSLRLHSFYERLETSVAVGVKSFIVPKISAIMGYVNEKSAGLDADHHTICKFSSKDCSNYNLVKNVLLDLIRNRKSDLGENYTSPIIQNASNDSTLALQDMLELASNRLDPQAFNWILDKQYFKDWNRSGKGIMLWLHGWPGTGKTTLSTFLLDNIRLKTSFCSFYLFHASDETKRKISAALLSIASQMSKSDTRINSMVGSFITTLKADNADATTIWQKLFRNCILRLDYHEPVYWLMDALDESDDPKRLLGFLAELHEDLKIKVFWTSRSGNETIQEATSRIKKIPFLRDQITEEDTRNDISRYISTQLAAIHSNRSTETQTIANRLLEKSGGSFLWVKRALEKIRTAHTLEDAEAALEEIPTEMDAMYKAEQEAIMALDERQQRLAVTILSFTLLATRPLSLEELRHLITSEPEFTKLLDVEYSLRRLCSGFLCIDEEKHVQWIHQTAREFLWQKDREIFSIEQELFSTKMASICINYLYEALKLEHRDPNELGRKVDELNRHTFASYALDSWSEHVRRSHVDKNTIIEKILTFLRKRSLDLVAFLFVRKRVPLVVEMCNNINKFVERHRRSNSPESVIHSSTIDSIDSWVTDIVRITTKFGKHILIMPQATSSIIPQLCPEKSAVNIGTPSTFKIIRTAEPYWTECISRFRPPSKLQITSIACSTKDLALASVNGEICIFNPTSLQDIRRFQLEEEDSEINFLEISDNERILIATTFTGAYAWDIRTGTLVDKCGLPDSVEILGVFPDPEKQGAYVVSKEGVVGFWQWHAKRLDSTAYLDFRLHADEAGKSHVNNGAPYMVCISSDLKSLAVAFRGEKVQIWDIEGRYIHSRVTRPGSEARFGWSTPKAEDSATCFDFKPQTKQLFIAYQDGSLLSWDSFTQQAIQSAKPVEAAALKCSPDGSFIVTGDYEGDLKIWTADTLELIRHISTKGDPIDFIQFSSSGLRFFDVRGDYCTAWEPEALARARVSNDDNSTKPSTVDPLDASESGTATASSITAIAVHQELGLIGYTTDSVEATVFLSKMPSSEGERTVPVVVATHGVGLEVYLLAWSDGGDFLLSTDDSFTIILSETRNEDGCISTNSRQKWILRAGSTVMQTLYDQRKGIVIAVTQTGYEIWDFHDGRDTFDNLKATTVIGWPGGKGIWSLCPHNRRQAPEASLVDFEDVLIFKEGQLKLLPLNICYIEKPSDGKIVTLAADIGFDFSFPDLTTVSKVSWVTFRPHSFVACEGHNKATGDREIFIFKTVPDQEKTTIVFQRSLSNIEALVGCFRSSIVFLDKDMWVCSIGILAPDPTKFVRHFFIPSDWMDANAKQAFHVTSNGDIVFTGKGEPVIVMGALSKIR